MCTEEMRWYKADLHNHSVLSPCGGLEMDPESVMQTAAKNGISIFALTDHNSLANCPAYAAWAKRFGIAFLYGVEIQTAEEIHLIALFDNTQEAMEFNELLYDSLLPIPNDPDFFGDQVVIDEEGGIVRMEERALINSSVWDLDTAYQQVDSYGGLCFPAHVDATTFSIIGQLGFIPPHLDFAAVSVTANCRIDRLLTTYPWLQKYPLFACSDAHYLADIGKGTTAFYLAAPTVAEIRKAFKKEDNRNYQDITEKL